MLKFTPYFIKCAVAEMERCAGITTTEEEMLEILQEFGDKEFFADEFTAVFYTDPGTDTLDTIVRDVVFNALIDSGRFRELV